MKHSVAAGVLAMALGVLGGGAQAQAAYTAMSVQLRAGPGLDYPVVAILPPGSQVWVQGCVEDYSWCDVVVGSERGWIYSGNIQSYYDDVSGYVPLYYGAWFGIAAYPFFINDYWGRYYYNRPWYPQLNRWANHHPPGRIHPPPVGRPPSRPGYGTTGPQPHGPGRSPVHPPAPGGVPMQPHVPGLVPGQPHGPGAARRPDWRTQAALRDRPDTAAFRDGRVVGERSSLGIGGTSARRRARRGPIGRRARHGPIRWRGGGGGGGHGSHGR